MNLIDTHSHIYLEDFDNDLPEVVNRARAAGISHIFLPNIDGSTVDRMLRVCSGYPGYCYPMIGLHPTSVKDDFEKELSLVEQQLNSLDKYIAIGEIGLDLYWDKTYLKEQIYAFDKQIQIALKYELPIVVHSREAFSQIYDVMKSYKGTALRGIFHSFTGSITEAEHLMEFDHFMLGINGVVTFKNSTLSDTLKHVPIERIVLETDAPYLTPVPYRGKRNESAYLRYTLMKISEIYGESPEVVAEITSANALKVFGLLNMKNERF